MTTTNKAFTAHFRCDHCDLKLTGHEQYIQHLSGKRHLKKLSEAGKPIVAKHAATNANAVAGYGGKFVTPAGLNMASNGAGVPSGIKFQPTATKFQPTATKFQPSGTGFQQSGMGQFNMQPNAGPRWNASVAPPPPPTTTAYTAPDPVAAAIRNNLLGKLPTSKTAYTGRCDVCNISYTSKSQEDMHLTGKKHKRKTQLSDGSHPTNSAEFYCNYCKMQLNSSQQMEQHTSGQSHKRKVDLTNKLELGEGPTEAKRQFQPTQQTESSQPTDTQ